MLYCLLCTVDIILRILASDGQQVSVPPPKGSPGALKSYHKWGKPWQLADLACHLTPEVICHCHSPTLEGFTWLYSAPCPPAWQEVAAPLLVNCCAWRGQEEPVSLGHYPNPAL